jgi:hypothetical protein
LRKKKEVTKSPAVGRVWLPIRGKVPPFSFLSLIDVSTRLNPPNHLFVLFEEKLENIFLPCIGDSIACRKSVLI